MKKIISIIVISICMLFASNQAHAIFIVDTGVPPVSTSGATLDAGQFLSGQFRISEPYTLISIQGWVNTDQQDNVTLNLYQDNGDVDAFDRPIPDTSSTLFSTMFMPSNLTGWQGVSGLDWNLNPGTYWLEFAVDSQSNYVGFMPFNPPSPLNNYAFFDVDDNLYRGTSSSHGVRIDANIIPEPATMLLFGSGIIGAFIRKRRQKQ